MAGRYVKLDDVMDAIGGVPKKKDSPYPTPIHLAAERIINKIKERIAKVPTTDVVEVVRCEKCKYGDISTISKTKDGREDIACYCNLKKVVTDVDGYCSSGEQRQKNDFKE